jgi:hypothetical protein
MKTLTIVLIVACVLASCSKSSLDQPQIKSSLADNTVSKANVNGRGGAREVLYDGKLVTVNMVELSDDAAEKIIESNQSTNVIYASNDLDEPQDFKSVIDAIPTDGFNPLWLQKLIVFNAGFTPHQFFSDEEVEAAASGANPEITLVNTGEIYRCSVIGG